MDLVSIKMDTRCSRTAALGPGPLGRIINRPIRIRCLAAVCFWISVWSGPGPVPVHAAGFGEYQVKAVFLYNLVHFIQWPSGAFPGEAAPFIIGVFGPNPFDGHLMETIQNEQVRGRPILVTRYADPEELRTRPCHLLFVSRQALKMWPLLKEVLDNRPVLTVSDVNGFAEMGGMANLLTRRRKIKIEINIQQVRRAGLGISAKLLNLADIVSDNPS